MKKFFGGVLSLLLGYGVMLGLGSLAYQGLGKLNTKVAEWTSPAGYHPTPATPDFSRYPIFSPNFEPGPGSETWKIIEKGGGKYGVSPNIIKAILQIETGFGRNQGQTNAWDYFQAEGDRENLEALQKIASELGIEPHGIRGSYKGCIGIPQFIPRNWLKFGVDGDADGKVDLFRSMPDAVHSVANYLVQHGYREDWEQSLWFYNWDRSYVASVKQLAGTK